VEDVSVSKGEGESESESEGVVEGGEGGDLKGMEMAAEKAREG